MPLPSLFPAKKLRLRKDDRDVHVDAANVGEAIQFVCYTQTLPKPGLRARGRGTEFWRWGAGSREFSSGKPEMISGETV